MVNLSVQKSVISMLGSPLRDVYSQKGGWQTEDVFQNRVLSRLSQQVCENFKDKGKLKQGLIQLPHSYLCAGNCPVPTTCPLLFESTFI